MRETMRSWHSPAETGIAALGMTEVPVPVPRPGELLVRVARAAVNFSDLLMIDGKYQVCPERPFIPGQEIAGTVVAAGGVAGIRPGDRVAGKVAWGGFAEYALMRRDMAISLPGELALTTAVALPVVYTTAMIALTEEASLRAGHSVLIHAAAGAASGSRRCRSPARPVPASSRPPPGLRNVRSYGATAPARSSTTRGRTSSP